MLRRPALSILTLAAVVLASCGSGTSHKVATGAATSTSLAPRALPGVPDSGPVKSGPTVPGGAPAPTTPGTPTSTAPGAIPGATPGATVTTSADAAPARKALDGYLAALAAADRPGLTANAIRAADALGEIRASVADVNAAVGGKTTGSITGAQFAPADATADQVTFSGSATLNSEVSGSKGDQKSSDAISGPVQVVRTPAGWRVATFIYNTKPLVFVNEQARQTVSGVELDVGYVLSYGTLTTAAIAVGSQSPNTNVKLADTTITPGTAAAVHGHGAFANQAHTTGLLLFSRIADTPTHLTATFARPDGSKIEFSLALGGQPS